MTLEFCSNLLQVFVTCLSAIWASVVALQKKTVAYTLAAGILVALALGLIYWLTYQYLMDVTPQIFYIADISWLASYLFILAFELHLTPPQIKHQRHILLYLPVLISLALALYFCTFGDVFFNICYMGTLAICGYLAMANFLFGPPKAKSLHGFFLLFIVTEYSLWLSSCFWISDTWTNPYFWFDFLLTAEIGILFPLVKKVVGP